MIAISALLVSLTLLAGPLYAGVPLVLTDDQDEYTLGLHADLLLDPQAQYTIEDISDPSFADRFIPSQQLDRHLGFSLPSGWIRFTLKNDAVKTASWIVELLWHGYDVYDLYIPDASSAQGWTVKRAGNLLPYAELEVKHRYSAHRLPVEPGETRTFYLHFSMREGDVGFPLKLWSEQAFVDHDHHEQILLGIYYGIICVMMLYNLFVFFSLRDRAYLYYVIMMFSLVLFIANINGITREYFWPESGYDAWSYYRINFLLLIPGVWVWIPIFVQTFLQTRIHAPRMHRALSVVLWANILIGIGIIVGQYQVVFHFIYPYLQFKWILVLATGIIVWRQGYRPARFFLIAWIAFIGGTSLLIFVVMGLLPLNFVTFNGAQIGHALEAILLSLALADRINILREEKEQEEESSRQAQLRAQTAELQAQIAEQELQTARTLQMGLMPTTPPTLAGFELAGRCLPASEVGGDFFQYFEQDGKLSLCMADVTGHAMEAAVPVMMFSGVLETEMQYGHSVERLLTQLNQLLHRKLDRRTFICFAIGEVHLETRSLRLANVGCPPLYHYRQATGRVVELEGGGYPLGVQPEGVYAATEIALGPGDRIVFCSDGLVEAANVQEEIFGFDQVAESIRQGCADDLSAAALIDRLIGAVQDFSGDVSQADDMTCVVLKVNTQG